VTTESGGDSVTAIVYASPNPGYGYYDTFWDAGTLAEARPPDGRLPAPDSLENDGFISNVVTSTLVNYMVVEWDTLEPASTQVLYTAWDSETISFTVTAVVYLPLVISNPGTEDVLATLSRATFADQTPVTHHQALLGPLQDGQMVRFIALSRRLVGGECQTSPSGLIETVFHTGPVYYEYLPLVEGSE